MWRKSSRCLSPLSFGSGPQLKNSGAMWSCQLGPILPLLIFLTRQFFSSSLYHLYYALSVIQYSGLIKTQSNAMSNKYNYSHICPCSEFQCEIEHFEIKGVIHQGKAKRFQDGDCQDKTLWWLRFKHASGSLQELVHTCQQPCSQFGPYLSVLIAIHAQLKTCDDVHIFFWACQAGRSDWKISEFSPEEEAGPTSDKNEREKNAKKQAGFFWTQTWILSESYIILRKHFRLYSCEATCLNVSHLSIQFNDHINPLEYLCADSTQ